MGRRIITFTSDFGLEDAYVAQVKARILSLADDACIVDIAHGVHPYGIVSAAWLLSTSFAYFPAGSVHLCVVDPGVGTSRAVLAVQKKGHFFVGPDNGVFSFLYPAQEVIEILWRPGGPVSRTFHGRDLFAPVAAEILKGAHPESLGQTMDTPEAFDISRDMVVHIDRFGTVITNIPCGKLKDGCSVTIGGRKVDRIAGTFSDIPPGELALVCGSASTVEIAANRIGAAGILGADAGMDILFEPGPHQG